MCVYLCKVYVHIYVGAHTYVNTEVKKVTGCPALSFLTLFPYDMVTR